MTVEARLICGGVCRTIPLTQYDEGQKIHLNGITLPASYLAEFANSESGTAEQITQTTDTVLIPDKYLTSGNPVYVWIVIVGQDERTTRYQIIVPVKGRGEPDDYTPTPEEQTAIEAAITALNQAVTAAGVAIEHYPQIVGGIWQVWDVTNGEWISTEVPAQGPQGETGATGNGIASAVLNADYTLTLTFTNGETYTTPSIRGAQGQDGAPGADGYSPTASVSKSGNTATITITDKDGTTTAQVSDGATGQTGPAGADGYSPTASVSKSGSTATISITDKQGTTTAQVTDGQPGQPGPGVPAGGTDGQMLVKDGSTDYTTKWQNQPGVPVQDVKVNGVSVLDAQGVANVPRATASSLGVVMPADGLIMSSADNGRILLSPASSSQVKGGIKANFAIDPAHQHESTFYGLAKAAGADMASSSNAVGNYTDAAKVAIQKMLGVYQPPYELIRDITLTERTSVNITVDDNGLPFELLTVFIEISYAANLESEASGYGRYIFYDSNGAYVVTETGRYLTNTNTAYKNIRVERNNNMVNAYFTRQSTTGGYGTWVSKSLGNYGVNFSIGNIVRIALNSADYEPSGTQIKIYGQRAY